MRLIPSPDRDYVAVGQEYKFRHPNLHRNLVFETI
jgi:hypothetical protein